MMNDELCVVQPRAAGLDVHKGHITATVRLAGPTAAKPQFETRLFKRAGERLGRPRRLVDPPPGQGRRHGGDRRLLAHPLAGPH